MLSNERNSPAEPAVFESPTETQSCGKGTQAAALLTPGVRVVGRYVIKNVLGAGGMSTVYEAVDTLLDRNVALKLLSSNVDARHAERFRREAIVGQEGHQNLVTTYDAGIWEGRFFLVMELVSGRSLSVHLDKAGRLPPQEVEKLAIDLLKGLSHLHTKGITHRDVKAGNVLMTEQDAAKLADFGLARMPQDLTVTALDAGIGTPAYMAPEQVLGEKVGPPADLYALGVLLYEAASGRRPFNAPTAPEVLHHHLHAKVDPAPLRSLPSNLSHLILRFLAKKPGDRFADADVCLRAWKSGRIRKPRSSLTRWIAGALLATSAVWIGLAFTSERAVRVEPVGTELRGVNRVGATAWRRSFSAGLQTAPAPSSTSSPGGFLVSSFTEARNPLTSNIQLLDPFGRTVSTMEPQNDSTLLKDLGYPGTLIAHWLLPATDLDNDGTPELLMTLYGTPWYFSTIVTLAPDMNFDPVILNPGIIEWADFTDADGDGEGEWYIAAMNNELLHTACVYRVDSSMLTWPPPRYGAEPAFPSLRWFKAFSREGGATFRSVTVKPGGAVEVVMQNGAAFSLDRWGNTENDLETAELDSEELAGENLRLYTELSSAHLMLLTDSWEAALVHIDAIDPEILEADPIADAFRLFLEARALLLSGDASNAERLAFQSLERAPISNDALLLVATIRILNHRWPEAAELIRPDPTITMGSPADFQEYRGHLAWLNGRNDEAWQLYGERGKLPVGMSAQHRARLLIGQQRFGEALEVLDAATNAASRERMGLLAALAHGLLGEIDEAREALQAELDRHPWQKAETEVVDAWLDCLEGEGSVPAIEQALAAARRRAGSNLYAFLDLPLLLAAAADAAQAVGDQTRQQALLDEARHHHPNLPLVSQVINPR